MVEKLARLSCTLFLALSCLWVSCAGKPPVETAQIPAALPPPEAEGEPKAPEPEAPDLSGKPDPAEDFRPLPEPAGMAFIPADLPPLVFAPGVGVLSREAAIRGAPLSSGERAVLQDSFRAAYVDGLLKDLPLAGVLGGDLVHLWPDADPSGWVQNWRSTMPASNSWGIPSLILAVQGIETAQEMAQDRVFVVDGEILNYYGTSAGLGGANGNIGYGSPRGEKFFHDRGIAQRFEYGLIVIDEQGQGSFLPGAPPSRDAETPPDLGHFPGVSENGKARDAFLTAWIMALDRGIDMVPDGPGQYLPSQNGASQDAGRLKGLYIQTFNNRTVLLILPDAPGIPSHARFLGAPFLEAFLSAGGYPLPGAEALAPGETESGGGDGFTRQLIGGISLYGFPLTDPIPYRAGGDLPWQETQRFSRGWLRQQATDSKQQGTGGDE